MLICAEELCVLTGSLSARTWEVPPERRLVLLTNQEEGEERAGQRITREEKPETNQRLNDILNTPFSYFNVKRERVKTINHASLF